MIPDLRFVIGAVIATALLGVTLFGLAAAMHISHQSKVGPLEASRLLAYTPDGRHRIFDVPAVRFDSPFANIPADPNPVPLQQAAEPAAPPVQTGAGAPPASLPQPAGDPDTVDERAVVEPPLPPDNETPAPAAAAAPPIETTPAAQVPIVETPAPPTAEVQQVGSIPAATDAAETRSETPANTEAPEAVQPKRKRAARKAGVKAKRAPVHRLPGQQTDPFAVTGYAVSTTSNANRPAKGFWPLD